MNEGTNMWKGFREEIKNNIKEKGVDSFLDWPIIHKTMKTDDFLHNVVLNFFEEKMIKFSDLKEIFEFGAGHGRFCKLIKERNFDGNYTIFDFPELIEIQKFYLKNWNKVNYLLDFNDIELPKEKSLFIAMNSLEESPKEVFKKMLQHAENYNYFIFKFSGGRGEFEEFKNKVSGNWILKEKIHKEIASTVLIGEKYAQ